MIEKNVRRFRAMRSVAGSKQDSGTDDGHLIQGGKIYIEIRPGSRIVRMEDAPVATYGLSLDTVDEHGGVAKYFDELPSVPFVETLYFKEYVKYWENDIQQKLYKLRESLKSLNNFSQMVGKPQYALREVNVGSPQYHEEAKHDFVMEGGEENIPETETKKEE